MNSQVKYGLRNANDLLNRIKQKYRPEHDEDHLYHSNNKTFLQESSLSLSEHQLKFYKINQNKSLHGPFQQQLRETQINPTQHVSRIQLVEKQENSFCERLIIQKLQQTLKVYEEDLYKMHENRCFLEDKIEFLVQKIKKLKEIEVSNGILAVQNQKAKDYLQLLVKEYHVSMVQTFRSQLSSQEFYNSIRSKIRILMKSLNQDHYYISFAEEWNHHIELLLTNRRVIDQMISDQDVKKKKEDEAKYKKITVNSKKMSFQDESLLAPQDPKPKKKLSQAEKASLLGDLKSFAKSFKFPNS